MTHRAGVFRKSFGHIEDNIFMICMVRKFIEDRELHDIHRMFLILLKCKIVFFRRQSFNISRKCKTRTALKDNTEILNYNKSRL